MKVTFRNDCSRIIFHLTVALITLLIIAGSFFYLARLQNIISWSNNMHIDYDINCYAIPSKFDNPGQAKRLYVKWIETECNETPEETNCIMNSSWREIYLVNSYVWLMILVGLFLVELSIHYDNKGRKGHQIVTWLIGTIILSIFYLINMVNIGLTYYFRYNTLGQLCAISHVANYYDASRT